MHFVKEFGYLRTNEFKHFASRDEQQKTQVRK